MDKQKRLKAKVLAESLRMMATKIENGFPITEEQQDMLKSLSKEIVFLHPTEYNKPVWEIDEEEKSDRILARRTTLPTFDMKLKEQKNKDIGKEPGE